MKPGRISKQILDFRGIIFEYSNRLISLRQHKKPEEYHLFCMILNPVLIEVMKSITLSIESQYHNVTLVNAAINKLCSLIPFGDKDTYATELCVTEAVVNSIKHAYQDEPDHTVAVIFCLLETELVIEVWDTGKSMDPTLLKVKRDAALKFDTMDTDNIPESGRGLAIMQSYMDEVHYRVEENGNYLTMKKKIIRSQRDVIHENNRNKA